MIITWNLSFLAFLEKNIVIWPPRGPFALHEKCPNMEFFLVRIFPYLDWMRKDTEYLSVFSPNAVKYGPEKTPYLDTFRTVFMYMRIKKLTL